MLPGLSLKGIEASTYANSHHSLTITMSETITEQNVCFLRCVARNQRNTKIKC